MKRIIYFLTLVLVAFFISPALAQEMNYSVTVNAESAPTVDKRVFKTLENSITEFLNNQKWTDDNFQPEERIECNLLITIKEEINPTNFRADLAIQATRPIYGSSQSTLLLNHLDKEFIFTYQEYDPILFSPGVFSSNLSAVLSFYNFIILGMDYDSFSPFGGEKYFLLAQEIVNTIPQNIVDNDSGWNSLKNDQNRFWIIENLLDPRVRPFRQAMYDYHRQALDLMSKDVGTGRAIMSEAIGEIGVVNQSYPNSIIIRMFANAKANEIVEIFKRGGRQEQDLVVRVMSKLDAANAAKYREIK